MQIPLFLFLSFCLFAFLSFCFSVFGADNPISTTGYILRGIFLVYENTLYLILLKPVQRRAGQKQCEESRAGLYPSLIVALITHFKLVHNTGYQPEGQIKVNFPEVWRPFPSFSFELEGLRGNRSEDTIQVGTIQRLAIGDTGQYRGRGGKRMQ